MQQVSGATQTILDVLHLQAEENGRSPIYTFLQNGESEQDSWTFATLKKRVQAVAAFLQPYQVVGERILVCFPPGLDYIAAYLGCLYAGALVVPAHEIEPGSYSKKALPRLEAMIRDAQPIMALTMPHLLENVTQLKDSVPILNQVQWVALPQQLPDGRALKPASALPDTPAMLMYTSGSTGTPRGVIISHANIMHNLQAFQGFEQRPCRTIVSWLPFYHDLGLFLGILHPLYRGVHAVLMAPFDFVKRPLRWLEAMSRYQGTTTGAPNFAYDLCVQSSSPAERAALDLSQWNMALNGAEPIRLETLTNFADAFAKARFAIDAFYPSFGMSDATATVTGPLDNNTPLYFPLSRPHLQQNQAVWVAEDDPDCQTVINCGASIQGQTIRIVDPETHQVCADGSVGEVWLSGPSVGGGYWNRPEESEATFQARLAEDDGRTYLRTGDLGFSHEGQLAITGRLKDLIIVRGTNYYPQDIEQTVAEVSPLFRKGCGVVFADDHKHEERVVIVQEVYSSGEGNFETIIAEVRQVVSTRYGLEIAAILLVEKGAVLKTSSGKLQRNACRRRFQDGKFTPLAAWFAAAKATRSAVNGATSPNHTQNEVKRWLCERVAELNGVTAVSINPYDTFTSHGLGSTQLVQLVVALEKQFRQPGMDAFPPTLLWEYPTIAEAATHLEAAQQKVANGRGPHRKTPKLTEHEPIAIIGMACRFPQAPNIAAYWHILRNGLDAVTNIPDSRWNMAELFNPDPAAPGKMITQRGGFLDDLDQFDNTFFKISPREATHLDPRQRIMLELTWELFEDAGIPALADNARDIGVYLAVLSNDYNEMLFDNLNRIDAYSGAGAANSIVANRISYTYNLSGPSLTLDTACSGSLVALHLACNSLRNGEAAMALAGGVAINLLPSGNVFFSKAGVISPDGRCQTFDARANGIVRSEGAGLILLKPLRQAVADGNRIYAVINGSAVNSDGRSNGLMAPNQRAQQAVLHAAYQNAGIQPDQVQYVETHGTGTALGDPIEVMALNKVLAPDREADNICRLGSLKTNFGHMEPAAGVAGIIKTALALHHRLLPPTINFETPNPRIPFAEIPFAVQDSLSEWPRPDASLIAGVSSFGFGGTNSHVVLSEAEAATRPFPAAQSNEPMLFPLSAVSAEALTAAAAQLETMLQNGASAQAYDMAYTLSLGRSHLDHRLAVVADSHAELASLLQDFGQNPQDTAVAHSSLIPGKDIKIAFVFSGQGSHWAQMGMSLFEREPIIRSVLLQCDALFLTLGGWSLLEALQAKESISRINDTVIAQAAIFSMQVALANLWISWGVAPDAIVGQSLGEVAAAHVAGALSLADAAAVVFQRSQLMAEVAGQGKTAVVGLPLEKAKLAVTAVSHQVSVAGSNAPDSSVLSGDPQPLQNVVDGLSAQGIFARMIKGVDIAFHSPQMDALIDRLVTALAHITPQPHTVPLYSTVTTGLQDGTAFDASYWGRNLRQPFLFADTCSQLISEGINIFLEVSPHPVIAPSVRACVKQQNSAAAVLSSLRRQEDERRALLLSAGDLYVHGVTPNWQAIYPEPGNVVSLPHYPWQRERFWFDQIEAVAEQRPSTRKTIHPLLGEPLTIAAQNGTTVFELELSLASLAWLDEHIVQGVVMFPGAAYSEMALAAAVHLYQENCVIEQLTYKQGFVMQPGQFYRLQLVISADNADTDHFSIYSGPMGQQGAAPVHWTLHAVGKIRHHVTLPAPAGLGSFSAIKVRCETAVSGSEHYQTMAAWGYEYGPAFQTVRQIWRRDNEALGQLQLPHQLVNEADLYQIHPVLLDNAFQIVSAALPTDTDNAYTPIPVGVDGTTLYRAIPQEVWCHVIIEEDSIGRRIDIDLYDAGGAMVGKIDGLRFGKLGATQSPVSRQVRDWFYDIAWREVSLNGAASVASGHWLLLADESGFGAALARQLAQNGQSVQLKVRSHNDTDQTLDITDQPSLDDLLAQMNEETCQGIVYCWGMNTCEADDAAQAHRLTHEWVQVVQAVLRVPWRQRPRLWIVTQESQMVLADETLHLAQSALWGAARVLGHWEHPELWGGIIDISGQTTEPQRVAQLLLSEQKEDLLAVRGAQLFAARLVPHQQVERPQRPLQLRPDKSYVVTGGLGELGLHVSRWLIAQGARHLILVGRSPLPPRKEWTAVDPNSSNGRRIAHLRCLENLGAELHYAALDVANHDQLRAWFDQYQAEGRPPVGGVIHSAGVLRDQLILHATPKNIDAVLAPKMAASWNLHRYFANQTLDFFVLFSSASSVLGTFGQAAYAAGNAFVDALAKARVAQGQPAISVNWGPWSGGGMVLDDVAFLLEKRGMFVIPPEQGVEALGWLLQQASSVSQAALLVADWTAIKQNYPAGYAPPLLQELGDEAAEAEEMTRDHEIIEQLRAASADERIEMVVCQLCDIVARVVRMSPERLDPHGPLNALGVDSIMAVELKNRIENRFGVSIAMVEILQGVSLYQFGEQIIDKLAVELTAGAELMDLLADVEAMSEADLAMLLTEMAEAETAVLST